MVGRTGFRAPMEGGTPGGSGWEGGLGGGWDWVCSASPLTGFNHQIQLLFLIQCRGTVSYNDHL